MERTPEQWYEILKDMSPEHAAKRILGDIIHYADGRSNESNDHKQLGNALVGYAKVIRNE